MTRREEWMAKNRKNYSDYSDILVISDASPIIYLNAIHKLHYLKDLFPAVYTTPKVREECSGVDFPEWIKIKEAPPSMVEFVGKAGFGGGEKTAIALALHIDSLLYENTENKQYKPCLVLDEVEANKLYQKLNFSMKTIKIRDVLSFAYDKQFFTKEEGEEIIELGNKTREFKKNDIMIIFNDTTTKNRGIKR